MAQRYEKKFKVQSSKFKVKGITKFFWEEWEEWEAKRNEKREKKAAPLHPSVKKRIEKKEKSLLPVPRTLYVSACVPYFCACVYKVRVHGKRVLKLPKVPNRENFSYMRTYARGRILMHRSVFRMRKNKIFLHIICEL